MMNTVKRENRLAASYKLRLSEAGISQESVALASPQYHPSGYQVSVQFVNRVLNRLQACPKWLRKQFDQMLAEAEQDASDLTPEARG